jgi:hypothetical protein
MVCAHRWLHAGLVAVLAAPGPWLTQAMAATVTAGGRMASTSQDAIVSAAANKQTEDEAQGFSAVHICLIVFISLMILSVCVWFLVRYVRRRRQRRRNAGSKAPGMTEAGGFFAPSKKQPPVMRFKDFYDTDSLPTIRPYNAPPRRKGAIGRLASSSGQRPRRNTIDTLEAGNTSRSSTFTAHSDAHSFRTANNAILSESIAVSPTTDTQPSYDRPQADLAAFPPRPVPVYHSGASSPYTPTPKSLAHRWTNPEADDPNDAFIVSEMSQAQSATPQLLPEDIALPADISPVPSPAPPSMPITESQQTEK